MEIDESLRSRAWKNFKARGKSECWIWSGYLDRRGYGVISVKDKVSAKYRVCRAHRVMWAMHNGPIPDGLCVLHHCDNPPCVNPDHLFLGTLSDNTRDMFSKGRGATGERHHMTTLKAAEVISIRSEYSKGGVTHADLARKYGTPAATICGIVNRTTWKYV